MIRAMRGQLKIEAVFPEGRVEINQFRKLKKAAGAEWEANRPVHPPLAKNARSGAPSSSFHLPRSGAPSVSRKIFRAGERVVS